jgi:WD40 repeat protein
MQTALKYLASIASVLALAAPAVLGKAQQRAVEAFTLATPAEANSFAIAKNGRLTAVACRDHKLRVWALPEVRIMRTIDLASGDIELLAMSSDGRWIVTAAHDGKVNLWDSSNGQVQFQTRLAHYAICAIFSHDGNVFAVDPTGEPVQVFDLRSGRKMYELNQGLGGTSGLAFSPDGSMIAAAGSDTAVSIYHALTGKLISRNTDFLLQPFTIDFTADGKQVVTAGADKVVAFIDTITGKTIRRM